MPVRNSKALRVCRAVFVHTKYAVHANSAPTASRSPREAVGAASVATEHDDRRARDRHRAPEHLAGSRALAEERPGDGEHEDRLERADDRRVGDAGDLDRAEEQDEVDGEGEPAEEASRASASAVMRPPVARYTAVTTTAPSQIR